MQLNDNINRRLIYNWIYNIWLQLVVDLTSHHPIVLRALYLNKFTCSRHDNVESKTYNSRWQRQDRDCRTNPRIGDDQFRIYLLHL